MDGATGVDGNAVMDVSRILQIATAENLHLADNLMKVTVEDAVAGSEMGKGGAIDVSG